MTPTLATDPVMPRPRGASDSRTALYDAPMAEEKGRRYTVYARVTKIRFAPETSPEVAGVARGLAPILRRQQGFEGLHVLTNADTGEGIIVSLWESDSDAAATESSSSYIGQMSMLSSFLYKALIPETHEVSARV